MTTLAVIEAEEAPPLSGAERLDAAEKMVQRFVKISAGTGLIPLPVWDAAAIFGVHVAMVKELSDLYDVSFSEAKVKHLVGALIGGLGAPILGHSIIGSMVKSIPGVGTLGGIVTVPALAAGSAYATGKVFIQHFESGGTFLSFDPKAVEAYYREKFDEGKAAVKSRVARATAPKEEPAPSEASEANKPATPSDGAATSKTAAPSRSSSNPRGASATKSSGGKTTAAKTAAGRGNKTSSTSKKGSKDS